jgi:hypothetical protein
MQYKVTIDFSYDLESDKDHDELLKNLEQELNDLTKGIVLNKRQIRLNKVKAVKHKTRIATFTPEELLPQVVKEGKKEFTIDGIVYTVRMDSSRYFVFKRSLACVACGIKGSKMLLEINQHDKSPHFNLYAEENGKLILMTKDHIHPKSKGGKNEIENYATMCCQCNNLKGNNDLTNEQVFELRKFYNENKNLSRKKLAKLIKNMSVQLTNNLTKTHGHLLKEWDYGKNQIDPSLVSAGVNKKMWWICKKGHEWEATIASRTCLKYGCPYCSNKKVDKSNCLTILFPELIKEWDFSKNKINPEEIVPGYDKKVWWVCKNCQYEWLAKVSMRAIHNNGCPNCAGMIVNESNCLATLFPELAKDWHPKNLIKPNEVMPYSRKKVLWLGKCGHEWEASCGNRTRGSNCPICKESRGERKIRLYLEKEKINFVRQYTFEKCRDKYKLPFDFCLYIDNQIGLIEYQGCQHFYPVEMFGGQKVFNETVKRDSIKQKFCTKNKIPLLKINYQNFDNTEKLIEDFIKVVRKVKMKKTKGAERLERIQKETNKLLCLVANTENEAIIAQIKQLMKVVNDSVAECEEEVTIHTKTGDADLGRWHVVSLGPDGQCSGFHAYKNGRDTVVKEIVQATEFMSKKDAQRVCDLLGKTYSVVGFPDKR